MNPKVSNVGAIISGALFSIGWWLFIDGASKCNVKDNCKVGFIDALPLVGATIFLILFVSFNWELLNADDFEYTGNCSNIAGWSRCMLFFYLLIGIGSMIGGSLLLIMKWSKQDKFIYFGIMQLIGTLLSLAAAFIWRITRNITLDSSYI
mmetsp:Transcript_62488/g.76507  ORF Transcript_62488/g.76507 Transcript_62488/m.76507 type:complete len:150 (+) Transcript_62488:61-510(+)